MTTLTVSPRRLRAWAVLGIAGALAAGCATTELHEVAIDIDAMGVGATPERTFEARDGAHLEYRLYEAGGSDTVLVFLHSATGMSDDVSGIGTTIAEAGLATVVTPTLRGHGSSPGTRGHIDYVGQLEDDLADLAHYLQKEYGAETLVLGGHSLTGGLALRQVYNSWGEHYDALLLSAPYVHFNHPALQDDVNWARPRAMRIGILETLNGFHIDNFNESVVLSFEIPADARRPGQTDEYTYNMFMSMILAEQDDRVVSAIGDMPLAAVGAEEDEVFDSDQLFSGFFDQLEVSRVYMVPAIRHMELLTTPEGQRAHADALEWVLMQLDG